MELLRITTKCNESSEPNKNRCVFNWREEKEKRRGGFQPFAGNNDVKGAPTNAAPMAHSHSIKRLCFVGVLSPQPVKRDARWGARDHWAAGSGAAAVRRERRAARHCGDGRLRTSANPERAIEDRREGLGDWANELRGRRLSAPAAQKRIWRIPIRRGCTGGPCDVAERRYCGALVRTLVAGAPRLRGCQCPIACVAAIGLTHPPSLENGEGGNSYSNLEKQAGTYPNPVISALLQPRNTITFIFRYRPQNFR